MESIHLDTLTWYFEAVFLVAVAVGVVTQRTEVVLVAVAAAAAVFVSRYYRTPRPVDAVRLYDHPDPPAEPPTEPPAEPPTDTSTAVVTPVAHREEVEGYTWRVQERLRIAHRRAPNPNEQSGRAALMGNLAPSRPSPYMVPADTTTSDVKGVVAPACLLAAAAESVTMPRTHAPGLEALGHPVVDTAASAMETEDSHAHHQ